MAGAAKDSAGSGTAMPLLFAPAALTKDGLHPSRPGWGDSKYGRMIAALLVTFTIDLRARYHDAPPTAGDPLPCLPLYTQVSPHTQEEHCFAALLEGGRSDIAGFQQLAPSDGTEGFRFTQFDTALEWDDGRGCSRDERVSK